MKTLDVVQGAADWLQVRAKHFCASEASAMMGASKYQTRNELLKAKATGLSEEITADKQRLFDRGHGAEASIRPHVESIIGEDLYPVTGADGELLASFDGLTMTEDTVFEHKLWSDELAAAVRAGKLDPHYYWQLEQQLLVSGAKRAIFVVSDGTPEKCVHMFYEPVRGRAKQLLAGWAQFKIDLDAWKLTEAAPAVTAAVTEALPAVSVRMDGAIAVISNLDLFGEKLRSFIEKIDKTPTTDQGFADAEAACKTLQKAQDSLEQAEAAALAQTVTIDEMRRTVGHYVEIARTTRLMLEKVVKQQKEQIRVEIKQRAEKALVDHVATINKRLGKVTLPAVNADFAGAMKGKKTLSGVQGAVDDELARVKIETNSVAERLSANLASLSELAAEHAFLFADLQNIVGKENEDFMLLVKSRIADHQAKEQHRLDAIREEERQRAETTERERLRTEELAKLQQETPPTPEGKPAIEPVPAARAATAATPLRQPMASGNRQLHGSAPQRPTDEAIVAHLADYYATAPDTVVGWLKAFQARMQEAA